MLEKDVFDVDSDFRVTATNSPNPSLSAKVRESSDAQSRGANDCLDVFDTGGLTPYSSCKASLGRGKPPKQETARMPKLDKPYSTWPNCHLQQTCRVRGIDGHSRSPNEENMIANLEAVDISMGRRSPFIAD